MLKNEFYELDDLTTIVVTYSIKDYPWNPSIQYQATIRYITCSKCLTVTTSQTSAFEHVKYQVSKIVEEMKAEYEQHIRTS